MFRHQGKSRTKKHNLRIATILSFVAGIVNVSGYLAFKQLTTNVTGHFALFIYDLANFDFWKGTIYFLYIFSFLVGSFLSSFLIEFFRETKRLNVFVLPTVIECLVLILIGLLSDFIKMESINLLVCLLLFAMGLQNSFVTKISNAVVRTTHLTGLFTDLGIDLSLLCFPKLEAKRKELKSNIKLRVFIILFFFSGGLIGGFLYSKLDLKLNALIFAALILIVSLFFDDFRYHIIKTRRKYNQKKTNQKETFLHS
ncbi:YoaK family protein [Polaribacter staleyi]|uniref:YoaK family protein n=1 Tax=Polaribacter staleyi TaxID=2022337 RepID=UPI0031BA8748